ncbi:hypothetical protein Hanom_Chr02g00119741 [Helianthus anomalus]
MPNQILKKITFYTYKYPTPNHIFPFFFTHTHTQKKRKEKKNEHGALDRRERNRTCYTDCRCTTYCTMRSNLVLGSSKKAWHLNVGLATPPLFWVWTGGAHICHVSSNAPKPKPVPIQSI